jgi:two-component system cell cycle response regulator
MGGEEFAVVMPETGLSIGEKIAERVRQRIAQDPIALPENSENIPVTISIGVAETNPLKKDDPNKVFDRADAALLRAKQKGRNVVVADASA